MRCKELFSLLFFLIIIQVIAWSQNVLQLEWIKAVGGTGRVGIQSINGTRKGFLMSGYIFAADDTFGCTQCSSNGNALLALTDTNGNQIYSHCYGGTAANQFYSAAYGKGGSVWAIGAFNATDGNFPNTTGKGISVVKFDSLYNPLWYSFYGSKGENDFGDFITTSDGGALILATTNDTSGDIHYHLGNNPLNFDAYLCKLDSAGNIKWLLILGGSGNQVAMKVKEPEPNKYSVLINTNSVDYMLTGINFDSLYSSPWLLEIDTGGNILSSRVVPNLSSFVPNDFIPISSGGLLLAGSSEPVTDSDVCYPGLGLSDFALIKVDSAYQTEWCKSMGGTDDDGISCMSVINDSLVAICGGSLSTDGGLIRCAPFGSFVYHGWLGLVNTNTETLVWQTSFCDSSDVTMIGLSYDSISQSLYVLMNGGVDGDFASAAINNTTYNTYLFKYSLTTINSITEVSKTNNALSLYPNPANNTCTLKMDAPIQMSSAVVFDAEGRQVMPLFNNQHLSTFDFNCNALATGLYFVYVKDEQGEVGVLKLVKQ